MLFVVGIALLFALLGLLLLGNHKESLLQKAIADLQISQQSELSERRQRLVYERALALPVTSAKAREDALWARTAQGDELSELILQEMIFDITSEDSFLLPETSASQA